MKTTFNTLILFVIFVGLMSSCVTKKKFNELQTEKDELAQQMEQMRTDLEGQINELKTQNDQLNTDKSSLNSELSNIKSDLSQTQSKVNMVQADVDDKQKQIDDLRGEISAAFTDVESAVTQSNQRITEMANMLYLDLDDPVNFRTASTAVNRSDMETLEELAEMLKANPTLSLVIEGHTDKRSISNEKYQDNWDLSVSRSTEVIRKLTKMGVNPEQLIASGRAEYMPAVTENPDSRETLEANRRTEFIVVPNIGRLYQIFKSQKP
ncbi:MAG: OmpA family protein [Melioribacteraceae bacterium]|nr:OmpA family protein [Melioribacteraceae bacterium]